MGDSTAQSPSIFKFFAFFFTIIFVLLNMIPISSSQSCPSSSCQSTEPSIQIPFSLAPLQDPSCGFPGFNLFCDEFRRTLIELPSSGVFTVHAVDYARQNIWLNDPKDCLARRLLELNLSGSPFEGVFFQDFDLFKCASNMDTRGLYLQPIKCLSNDSYTVFASSQGGIPRSVERKCAPMTKVSVPVRWDSFEVVISSDLSEDIRLKWETPRCGSSSGSETVVWCRNNAVGRRMPRVARYAIIVGAGVPAFLCLLGFICFISSRMRRRICQWRYGHRPTMEFSMPVAPHPLVSPSPPGLDGPTIESYPKTTLGESCRLPNPDDNICSICLSEYMAKDTLRSIPECRHSFHAECIDKWLQQHVSCPICRNSLKPSPDHKPGN